MRLPLKTGLSGCVVVVLLIILSSAKREPTTFPAQQIDLELSISHGESGMSLYKACSGNHLYAIFRNRTDSAIRLFETWNMWGYFTIWFEIETPDSTYKVYRNNRDFDKNFPSYNTVNPGESLVVELGIKGPECSGTRNDRVPIPTKDSEWAGLPEKKYDSAKIRVVYNLVYEVDLALMNRPPNDSNFKKSFPTELFSRQYNIRIR
jgi:hypothetical protein